MKYRKNSLNHDLNSRDSCDNYTVAKRLQEKYERNLQYTGRRGRSNPPRLPP